MPFPSLNALARMRIKSMTYHNRLTQAHKPASAVKISEILGGHRKDWKKPLQMQRLLQPIKKTLPVSILKIPPVTNSFKS